MWLGLEWLDVEMENESAVVELDGPFPLLVGEFPKAQTTVMGSLTEQMKWSAKWARQMEQMEHLLAL
jgi:hypothetical protein